MADCKFSDNGNRTVHEWKRKDGRVIRFAKTRFRGVDRYDLRIWYKKNGKYFPAKSGISFREDEIENVLKAFRRARKDIA